MRRLFLLVGLVAALFAGGCAQLDRTGTANLADYRRVFVEQRLNDNLGIHRALVAELRQLGYAAESGPSTMMPDDTELILTYDARETWDFRPYLIELQAAVRPAQDYNRILVTSRYFRPGVTKKSPEQMVHELLKSLFAPATAKTKPARGRAG
ncbi:MAG: hypothetical protein Q8M02_10945 [Candidatus Didemnitutus sp.]|nr:hypothetical protein [Candidatus Didemnitutus sp.]